VTISYIQDLTRNMYGILKHLESLQVFMYSLVLFDGGLLGN